MEEEIINLQSILDSVPTCLLVAYHPQNRMLDNELGGDYGYIFFMLPLPHLYLDDIIFRSIGLETSQVFMNG